jgi:peptidoglycan/xylan/chitin deacetylase (PgdA/CDA1 family)
VSFLAGNQRGLTRPHTGRLSVVAGAVAAGAHVLPLLGSIQPLRRALLPSLTGLGRPGHAALTFDDGPDPVSTPAFLAVLDRLGWHATFFMLGSMVAANPSLAAEVASAGHEIALHGNVHRSHLLRTLPGVVDDLRRGRDVLEDATGRTPRWHRPPYGALSGPTLVAARQLDLRVVLWSTWGRDWRREATGESVAADVQLGWAPGATVLLHDSDATSAPGAWRAALDALPRLAEWLEPLEIEVGPLGAHGVAGAGRVTPGPGSRGTPGEPGAAVPARP